jgi:hypothetical protein
MSRACVALSDFDISSEYSSSSKEDEKVNYKKKEGDFTWLCLMAWEDLRGTTLTPTLILI